MKQSPNRTAIAPRRWAVWEGRGEEHHAGDGEGETAGDVVAKSLLSASEEGRLL
jgi:hypothetical protein